MLTLKVTLSEQKITRTTFKLNTGYRLSARVIMNYTNHRGQMILFVPQNKYKAINSMGYVLCFITAVFFTVFCINQAAKEQILHDNAIISKLKQTSKGIEK